MATAKAAASRRATTAKAVVISAFTDLRDGERVYRPGEEFEGTKARVSELRKAGYLGGDGR